MIDNFLMLYHTRLDQGHISDEVFDRLGFPKDIDVHGNEISRDAGISQESYQRSKSLTHSYQVNLRQACVQQIMTQQRQCEESAANKENAQLHVVSQIEEKLLQMIVHNDSSDKRSLEQCTLEMFDRVCSHELEDFIFAHDPAITLKKIYLAKRGVQKMQNKPYKMTHHLKTTEYSLLTNVGAIQTSLH